MDAKRCDAPQCQRYFVPTQNFGSLQIRRVSEFVINVDPLAEGPMDACSFNCLVDLAMWLKSRQGGTRPVKDIPQA